MDLNITIMTMKNGQHFECVFVKGVVLISKVLASCHHFNGLSEAHLTLAFLQRALGNPKTTQVRS